MTTRSGVTASALLTGLVDGPPQELEVVHRSRLAWQLADRTGRVVCCVMIADSVRLPHGVVVPSIPRGSSPVSVGDGTLGLDGRHSPVTRWWAPRRPRAPHLRRLIDDAAAERFAAHWADRLGAGEGLTPFADDVVCGSLVALRAAGHPLAPALERQVLAAPLERRTTAASAALLRLAARGYCIDQLADHLADLDGGGRARPASLSALRAVGASSGRGLIRGVDAVLADPAARAVA